MNPDNTQWLAASLDSRIVAVLREYVVRYVLKICPDLNIAIGSLLVRAECHSKGIRSHSQLPPEIIFALSELARSSHAPCAATLKTWVKRYRAGGFMALLPRYRGGK
jgi:hypothetical protein